MFLPIISYLDEHYYVSYKNKYITKNNPGLFRIIYLNNKKDLRLVRKRDNVEVKIESINHIINTLWNDTQKKIIEDFFHDNIENDWNSFLEEIKKINSSFSINKPMKRYIMLFITLQLFRSGLQIDKYLLSINPSFVHNNYQQNNIQNSILIDTLYEFIIDFNQNKNTSSNIIYNTFINLMRSNWNFNFNINHQETFLTSDTPVFVDNYNIQESIIFPITPSICLVLTNSLQDIVKLKELTENEIQIINHLIIKNAKEYIAYNKPKIDDKIYISYNC